MEKNKKNNLFEADYVERALDYITKHVKSKGKSPDDINAIRAKVEKRLKQLNPNVSKSSALKTFKSTMDDKKNNLFEADYSERILDLIDRYAKSKGKSREKINDLRAKVEDKLKQLNPNVSKSSALKTFKSTMDDKKNNSITESDIEKLLEYMVEADKAKKQDTEPKQEPKAKQEPKPQPKQKDAPKEEPVTPSEAVTKLMKSSGGSNFMQDVRRMGSKQQKIESYLQLIMSLPGIGNSEVRRAIVNKLKVSEK